MTVFTFFLIKLLADFGLVVLISLVQLVIYPGFKYYNPSELNLWHHIYTRKITFIVLPLMLAQLIMSLFLLMESSFAVIHIIDFSLVILMWVSTFAVFVPLHRYISQNYQLKKSICRLIRYNWFRTIIWFGIFILNLYVYYCESI